MCTFGDQLVLNYYNGVGFKGVLGFHARFLILTLEGAKLHLKYFFLKFAKLAGNKILKRDLLDNMF